MSIEFIDFDKLFEQFMQIKFADKKNISPESVMEQLGELYQQWAETPLDILGNSSPCDYYKGIDDVVSLIEFLVKSCEADNRPNSFLLDRISELSEAVPLLTQLIYENKNPTLTLTAIELIQNIGAPQPLEFFLKLLQEDTNDSDLKEQIIEILSQNADAVKEKLYKLLSFADIQRKTVIAEILINAQKDERTLALLSELFIESENIPLISSYIGRYGDERLASMLYKALDTCNYMEFIEIKSAIERMGGIVEDSYDFSEDIYYKIIKNGNSV